MSRRFGIYVMHDDGRVNFRSVSFRKTFDTKRAGQAFMRKQVYFGSIKYAVLPLRDSK
jgi:hypothetical protein